LATAIEITNRVLQDALKEHRELFFRAVAVFFREFHHGILNDVQGVFFVADSEQGLLEGTSFNAFKEQGELVRRGQRRAFG
ncbi:MAG: hypothetical protein RBS35_03915, partial [Azonexus sp.]|nr:hypothetical protein [Azonexus sp.]